MFDERWPAEAEELADALDAVLAKYSAPDVLRSLDDRRSAEPGEGLDRLRQAVAEFGLWELPTDPLLVTRAAMCIGAHLAPVPFVSVTPCRIALGESDVANGLDRSTVPAGVPRIAVAAGAGVGIVATSGSVRISAAGEPLVLVDTVAAHVREVSGDAELLRAWGFLLEAARLVGAAQMLIRYGVEYVSERKQFGVPVGSFQGVAHPLAEAATAVQAADLLTRHAAYLADCDGNLPLWAAVMAAAKARTASRQTASTVHQALGGYGFTIEADCQLYSRRIRSWTSEMPDPVHWLADMARTLADPIRRDGVKDLWQFDRGFTLPRWARQSD
ncbi:acyl-CoA dehydrogenase family protein [Mycobacterium sp. CVI_P3]|uniref:Acyl-CoA dehydrogenase family protein n=1 Tax=Mycobacterium pinniadriaticum TaxID=2994102 RepID=A0ABT3SBX4_9MYCO|nr:acyl-CoA dehydrogenase family protein [Mycobacterium pinniadriaticum]MCX2930596.1 acyl-CoA dehydrogenase family protein [Mycobacterium pinniadriaticum]MCX2937020.1 acyl-CoA dehydrogenase family protein [Mycobacterium pinniadriaticum]